MKNRPLEPSKTFWGHKGKAGRSVGVSCRDFVPPEKAWPFQVVQVGGIAEKPRAFGRMPPTMHESTKHQQRGRRPESIDRFPKKNGSGIPDSSPFHKKYVARPQIKFSDRPLFQKGSPGAGREPCKDRQKRGNAGTHRPAPIDRHPKINGFGLLGLLTFSKKHVVCPQKKFSDRPLFQKGAPGCRAGSPARTLGCRAGSPAGK